MTDFKAIEKTCRETNRISESVVDEFLIYYAARRDKLDREIDKQPKIWSGRYWGNLGSEHLNKT